MRVIAIRLVSVVFFSSFFPFESVFPFFTGFGEHLICFLPDP